MALLLTLDLAEALPGEPEILVLQILLPLPFIQLVLGNNPAYLLLRQKFDQLFPVFYVFAVSEIVGHEHAQAALGILIQNIIEAFFFVLDLTAVLARDCNLLAVAKKAKGPNYLLKIQLCNCTSLH